MLHVNSFFFFSKLIPILASLNSCVLCPSVFCEKSIPFVVVMVEQKGEKTQLLASNLTLLVTELQNLDDTGGIRKNICRWNITAGRELLFFSLFFYTNVPDHGREMVSEDMQILCSHL